MSPDEQAALARLPVPYRRLMLLLYRRIEREPCSRFELVVREDGKLELFRVQHRQLPLPDEMTVLS